MNVMDKNVSSNFDGASRVGDAVNPDGFDLSSIISLLKRRWITIVTLFSLTFLAGLVFVFTTTARYTAVVDVLIDSGKTQLLKSQAIMNDGLVDTSMVDSQVEILKSERIALNVIRELKLQDDAEFNGGRKGQLSSVFNIFQTVALSPEESDFRGERAAISVFQKNIKIQRQGRSYVLQISFTSENPDKAARIANAVADSYILDLLESKYEITKRASTWLQERINELSRQAMEADRKVQTFKTDNNIVETGRGLMNEQQLAEVNSQLITARAVTAEAKARFDRMNEVMANDVPDASVTDALKNDVIIRLRGQFLDLAKREADWSARYGTNHLAAINLRTEMTNIRANIRNELRRIAESYKSEYEIAKAREDSLVGDLRGLVDQSGTTNQAQIQLKDMESSAQTSRMLYNSFLQRFMEATQQQSFPITDTRVITMASRPLMASYPQKLIFLAGACFLGVVLGVGGAVVREQLDNVFRTRSQLEDKLGVEALGVLARLQPASSDLEKTAVVGKNRIIANDIGNLRYVVNDPFSRFTETIRAAKVAADISKIGRNMKVIGVVSSLPGEGKTLVAANLAQLIAHSGGRCVLIDGDLRNPSMTRNLAPHARAGLIEFVKGDISFQEVAWTDPITGLMFVPAFIEKSISHTNEIITSRGMESLLKEIGGQVDYIIIDLPPLVPVIDAKAVAGLIDGFVFVVEWGVTSQNVVKDALNGASLLRSKILGAVLNKVNLNTMKRFENYTSNYYYYKYHSHYGDNQKI